MSPTVLVTGGAKRIGAVLARAFGEAGWHVIIHYGRSRREAEELAVSLPSAEIHGCDLNDWDAPEAMIEAIAGRCEDWRLLINCASVFHYDLATRLDPEIFDEAMQVNAGSPTRMAQAYLRHARAKGGRRVIQITDQKIANPNPDFFSYTMSKHAFASTIRMLAMAQDDPRDRVYGIAPGAILASHDQSQSETETSHRMNLLNHKTDAEEIARAALFLGEGWLASGETLYIDSGQHLLSQRRDVLFLAREQSTA